MKTLRLAGFLALAALCVSVAQSDLCACAAASRAGEGVHIAEESAIIVWDAATKTQHFIRRAQFDTKAKDFGFLVPTPTRPALSEVDDAVFGYLLDLTRPPVREAPPRPASAAPGEMVAKSARAAPVVTVLETATVAGLDAVVLAANDANALDKWLKAHGYASSPELAEWFKPYIAAKWIFTAFKISKGESGAGRATTSAVRMSFSTERPFFPYREPASGSSSPRALEVYFVSGERVEGRIGASAPPIGVLANMGEKLAITGSKASIWPGRALWAEPLSAYAREDLLKRVKLPPGSIPATAWLTRFLDSSAPRRGTDELYFSRSADQARFMDENRLHDELERKSRQR